MTVQIMVMAGLDPAAVIGGKLPLIDGYGRYGAGRNIVVEACEYHNTFFAACAAHVRHSEYRRGPSGIL